MASICPWQLHAALQRLVTAPLPDPQGLRWHPLGHRRQSFSRETHRPGAGQPEHAQAADALRRVPAGRGASPNDSGTTIRRSTAAGRTWRRSGSTGWFGSAWTGASRIRKRCAARPVSGSGSASPHSEACSRHAAVCSSVRWTNGSRSPGLRNAAADRRRPTWAKRNSRMVISRFSSDRNPAPRCPGPPRRFRA